ncbi:RecA-like DNA recombinase [Microbacterium phage Kelcole]|nr:RecA-like DNA recombinase [Microbacterium phage Kelcole]
MNQPMYRRPRKPPAHIQYAHEQGRGMLTFRQIEELVKAINPAHVETKQRLTYLSQHQARAEMNRIFGYGNWDVDAGEPVLMYEYETPGTGNNVNKMYWRVGYRIKVTVNIRDLWGMPVASFTGVHAEQNAPQPDRGEAHALALTSVDSYAMRRALINLGDRFGLGLYDGGSLDVHGGYTIQEEPGQLYDWAPVPTQEQQNAPQPPPQQENQQQGPPPQDHMPLEQAQQAQAAGREAARQQQGPSPAMQQRLQQGLKVDENRQEGQG